MKKHKQKNKNKKEESRHVLHLILSSTTSSCIISSHIDCYDIGYLNDKKLLHSYKIFCNINVHKILWMTKQDKCVSPDSLLAHIAEGPYYQRSGGFVSSSWGTFMSKVREDGTTLLTPLYHSRYCKNKRWYI